MSLKVADGQQHPANGQHVADEDQMEAKDCRHQSDDVFLLGDDGDSDANALKQSDDGRVTVGNSLPPKHVHAIESAGLDMNVLLGPLLQLREKDPFAQRKSPMQFLRHHFGEHGRSASPPQPRGRGDSGASRVEDNGGEDADRPRRHVFCELAELHVETGSDVIWKECARWIKFEEDVEEGGERWSKPHVATLSLHSLMELRCCFVNPCTVVLLNLDASTIEQVAEAVMNQLDVCDSPIDVVSRERVRNLILLRHAHLFSLRRNHTHSHPHNKESFVARSFAEISHRLSASTRDLPEKDTREQTDNASTPETKSSISGRCRKVGSVNSIPLDSHARGSTQSVANDSVSSANDKSAPQRKTSGLGEDGDTGGHQTAIKFDTHFMKKIPAGAETANILVGEADFLETQFAAFVRLSKASILGDLTEVPVPTRFIFILLLPKSTSHAVTKYREIGRSIATLMSDEIFHDVAYEARSREDLLVGIDEFLSNVTVIPPGEWDPTIRIEPPQNVPSQQPRKEGAVLVLHHDQKEAGTEEGGHGSDDAFKRSGRLFGGLAADVKRKLKWYMSDFRDGFHVQSIAAIVFLYFACLAPTVTFGGMLNVYLDGYMATMESILSASLCGIVFSLFAGQPLTILGSTGPVLIFEKIVYNFAKANDIAFMTGRLWIGIWIAVMLLIAVAFDLSYLVRYITRFTEESFSCLVALIFIVEAFEQLRKVAGEYPVVTDPVGMYTQYADSPLQCVCLAGLDQRVLQDHAFLNQSWLHTVATNASLYPYATAYTIRLKLSQTVVPPALHSLVSILDARTGTNITNDSALTQLQSINLKDCTAEKNRFQFGKDCTDPDYVPDVFFFSVVLFIGTFVISYTFKVLKTSRFFRARVRELLSDFAVVIAILTMTLLDSLVGLNTPKLDVPAKFQPTLVDRGWLISPFSAKLPVWFIFAAIIPAGLATILIFMDQQITAVIVNRKENKMRKGVGYHLDLLVVAILILLCSFLGLPWFVASTVPSINHAMALRKETRCNAPGERPKYLGCRENRLTGVMIAVLTGLSVFLTGVLQRIPVPVLHGVFLFMGISCLNGIELVHRVLIMIMPSKNQPDYVFLRNVRMSRVHLFTAIQVISIATMWVIKSIELTAVAFPLLVLAMCFVRKALDHLFTQRELLYLDDIIPEEHKREKEQNAKRSHVVSELLLSTVGHLEVPLPDGNVISIKVDSVTYDNDGRKFNLGEHVNETKIWKDLVNENEPNGQAGSQQNLPCATASPGPADQDETKLLLRVPNERRQTVTNSGLWVKHKKRVVNLLKIRKPAENGRSVSESSDHDALQNPAIAVESV